MRLVLAVALSAGVLSGCAAGTSTTARDEGGGRAPATTPSVSAAVAGTHVEQSSAPKSAMNCPLPALRISRAFWVSPPTQTDADGVLIRNVSSSPCELRGPVHAVVSDPGYPDLLARGYVVAIGPGRNEFMLAPGAAAGVIVADSHGCATLPTHRYHRVTLTFAGHRTSVRLPDQSSSSDPDFNRRRLSLAVDEKCGPFLSGFVAPPAAPRDVW